MPAENLPDLRRSAADRRVEDARMRLMLARSHTQRNLDTLQTELAERLDWRHWLLERPVPVLLTAFVVGFLLGSRR